MPPRNNNKKKGRGKGEKKTKVQKKIEKEGKCAKVQEMYRQLKADYRILGRWINSNITSLFV